MHRKGLTITELLTVIVVIGTLCALLLPAIQAAREASRRSICTGNLRQLALAVHLHDDALRYLPPAGLWRDEFNPPDQERRLNCAHATAHGWIVFLLPYLEQGNIPYSRQLDCDASGNEPARLISLPILRCPSSPTADRDNYLGITGSPNDYTVCRRVDEPLARALGYPSNGSLRPFYGALPPRECGKSEQIVDGFSHTLLIGESAARTSLWEHGRLTAGVPQGALWPDVTNTIYLTQKINQSNVNGFYAFHPNGMVCCFCDGSTRLLSQDTDLRMLASLVTRECAD